MLYNKQYSKLPGHPGARQIYYTLRQHYYRLFMTQNVHAYVSQWKSCERHRPSNKLQELPKLFSLLGPLKSTSIDILGPLMRIKHGSRFIIVLTNRYTKYARSIPAAKKTTQQIAKVVLKHSIKPYGIPDVVLTDNSKQSTSKFFAELFPSLVPKLMTTTEYHAQCNEQVEWYNRAIVARLRHYLGENQQYCDVFVQPLIYAYNTQKYRTTGLPSIGLMVSLEPPGFLTFTGLRRALKMSIDWRRARLR